MINFATCTIFNSYKPSAIKRSQQDSGLLSDCKRHT